MAEDIMIAFYESAAEGQIPNGAPCIQIRKKASSGHWQWYYMSPEPKLSFTSQPVNQGNTRLGTQYSVTLSAWALPHSGNPASRSRRIMQNLSAVQGFFEDADQLQVFGNPGDAVPLYSWPVLNPTVSVDESDFYTFVRFNIQFEGFSTDGLGSVSGLLSDTGENTGNHVQVPLESFSDTFTYEPDDSFGVPYDDPTAQVYRFTRTLSAKGRSPSNAWINKDSAFNANAVSGVKAFVDHRAAIDEFKPYVVTDNFRYIDGLTVFNLSHSFSIDLGELTYSVTTQGFYADGSYGNLIKQSGAFETFSTNVQKESNSSVVNVTIDGALTGYAVGQLSDPQRNIKGNQSAGALYTLNRISANGSFGWGSVVFKRAQAATSAVLNAVPKSISIGDSTTADGKITYSVQYDNRPTNLIDGAISESITVNDTYPTDVYASIQVMGKRGGPVFQYMNTTTNFERDVSIEVVMDTQRIANIQGPPYGLLNQSPSVDSTTRGTINSIINSMVPGGPNVSYCMLKQCNESWSPKEGRYTVNVGWTYG